MEATELARALRASVWAYPLVNAGHILGVALLVGAIVPLDLRLLGAWRSIPPAPLWRVLTRSAAAGLALAIVCGVLLFTARAPEYVRSSLFVTKMSVVAIGVANALLLRGSAPEKRASEWPAPDRIPLHVRVAAAGSLVAWLTALVLGRLVGYF